MPKRNPTIDGLKLVAAASIVLLHVAGVYPANSGDFLSGFTTSASYGALFFFFTVSGYLHGAVGTRGWRWTMRRLVRLAVPYAAWSALYLTWGLVHAQPAPAWWYVTFFAGAKEVLWSLPMLMICALLAEMTIHKPWQRRLFLLIWGALAIWSALFAPVAWNASPARQFLFGARWPLMYAIGMEIRASRPRRVRVPLTGLAIMVVIISGVLGSQDMTPYPLRLYTLTATSLYTLESALVLYGAHVGRKWFGVGALAWGGPYLLGIYVSHYFWLELVMSRLPVTSLPMAPWIAIVWTVVFSAALLSTRLLYSFKWTRPTVA